jgi:hypothetical protein
MIKLPPLAPKTRTQEDNEPVEKAKIVKCQIKNLRVFHDNVILINPNIDSSDKELH